MKPPPTSGATIGNATRRRNLGIFYNDRILLIFFRWLVKFFADYTNLALIAIALVSGGMLAWPVFKRSGRGLSTMEATQLINRKGAVVLDVRSTEEFAGGHLPSARNVPLDDVEQKVGQVIKNKAAPVLIVCKSGQRSARAQTLLRNLGYAESFSLQGGLAAWQEAGLPVVK